MILDIHFYGDPILREPFKKVASFDEELKTLADRMVETMRASRGVGLAAQQVGETRAICVIEVPEEYDTDDAGNRLHPDIPMPWILVNPVLSGPSKRTDGHEEGCLSFPDIRGNIERPVSVTLDYQDLEGAPHTVEIREFLARVVQHEVDHLNGVLFIDRMSAAKKLAIRNRLRRLKADTEAHL